MDGGGIDRVLHAHPFVALSVSDLTVRGGAVGTEILAASGILADRDLHVQRAVVSGNVGNGIGSRVRLTLRDVIVANNGAAGIHLFGVAERSEFGVTSQIHRSQFGPVLLCLEVPPPPLRQPIEHSGPVLR